MTSNYYKNTVMDLHLNAEGKQATFTAPTGNKNFLLVLWQKISVICNQALTLSHPKNK